MSVVVASGTIQTGVFNSSPVKLTNGQTSFLQTDSVGNLLVNINANATGTLTVAGIVAVSNPFLGVSEQQGSPLLELLTSLIYEVRALRLATVANTCDGGRYKEQDFDPAYLAATQEFLSN